MGRRCSARRTRPTLAVLSAAASVVVAAGVAPADRPPNPPTRPSTVPATRPAVPVVYTSYGRNLKLTAAQAEAIVAAGLPERPAGRDVWFVAVQFVSRHEVWASAVFTPDEAGPRLRRGRCADVRLTPVDPSDRSPHEATIKVDARSYVQVSPAGRPFGDQLDVPAAADLPFPPPVYPPALTGGGPIVPLDDRELVGLVDFARSRFRPAPDDDPICWVVGDGDGLFGIARGVSDWGGDYLHVVRGADGGFRIVREGGWADADTVAWPRRVRPDADDPPR
jgi:hypothetical protein